MSGPTKADWEVYHAEFTAFEGTPLGDLVDRTSLMRETVEVATRIPLLAGEVTVREGTVRMIGPNAKAGCQEIIFAPKAMPRFTPVHELAHIVHNRSGLGGKSHGSEYRGVYVHLITVVYGVNYGHLLGDAFIASGLPIAEVHLPWFGSEPMIDLDRLSDVTRGIRWLA